MKDIAIYEHENGNLASVKSVEDIYPDRMYLVTIIDRFIKLANGSVRVEASRPNYEIDPIIEKLKKVLKDDCSYQADVKLSFTCNDVSDELIYILPEIWFAYQHSAIIFFFQKDVNVETERAWYNITSDIDSIIMFRGAEEDVVWIGKSDNVELDHADILATELFHTSRIIPAKADAHPHQRSGCMVPEGVQSRIKLLFWIVWGCLLLIRILKEVL